MTVFEYNDDKSQANLLKHGIDFVDAQMLWNDPDLLEIRARSDDEPGNLSNLTLIYCGTAGLGQITRSLSLNIRGAL